MAARAMAARAAARPRAGSRPSPPSPPPSPSSPPCSSTSAGCVRTPRRASWATTCRSWTTRPPTTCCAA
ncbi:hypothetical protein E8D34_19095 [Nocardioides sp. GY 10113]|nr:hypothetical protein E8D34_19095 [Nocardioides sp. GY 10113]